jgi:hypothetical protein
MIGLVDRLPRSVRRSTGGHALDHLVRDIETGRFERALSGITAVGALVTGLEIVLEHDRASFGNAMMWLPVTITPVVSAAAIGGVFSKRLAKTALPLTSLVLLANSIQGTYLHIRGIAQRPGGWRELRYNAEMGPPLFAPLLAGMVGGMGVLAAILRREG